MLCNRNTSYVKWQSIVLCFHQCGHQVTDCKHRLTHNALASILSRRNSVDMETLLPPEAVNMEGFSYHADEDF